MSKSLLSLLVFAGFLLLTGCQAVKSYQKQFVNDDTMQQSARPVEKLDNEATTYREGASGGEAGKTGGGCGCN